MTVLVDSWAWVEYYRGSKKGEISAKYIDGKEPIIISAINLYEIYRKSLIEESLEEAERKRSHMLARAKTVNINEIIAIEAAKIGHNFKLHMADAIVYATAKLHSARIVTGDEHLKGLEGVTFIG